MPEATDTPDQRRARRSREVRSRYPGGATDTPAGAYVTAARPPTPAERAEVGALLNSPAMRRRLRRDRSQLVRMPIDPTPEAAAARLARLALRQAGYWATPPRPRRAASPLQRGRRGSSRRQPRALGAEGGTEAARPRPSTAPKRPQHSGSSPSPPAEMPAVDQSEQVADEVDPAALAPGALDGAVRGRRRARRGRRLREPVPLVVESAHHRGAVTSARASTMRRSRCQGL